MPASASSNNDTGTGTDTPSSPSASGAPVQPSVIEASPSLPDTTPAEATPKPEGDAGLSDALAPPPAQPARRKGIPGPKPGSKRSVPSLGPDGAPKPRGKPGPKKKPRPGDPVDANGNLIGQTPLAPKLGPKANTGAINAGLRALDRSGRPCKRWVKRGLSLKSFTGVNWEIASWGARRGLDENGDIKSESSGNAENGSEDMNGVTPSSPAPMPVAA